MKFYLMIFGLAIGTSLIPAQAFAQNFLQGNAGSDGSFSAPLGGDAAGGDALGATANPFAGASGASKFYQDNSFGGSPALSSPSTPSINDNPTGPLGSPMDSPMGSTVGGGALGGGLGGGGSSAQDWATTP